MGIRRVVCCAACLSILAALRRSNPAAVEAAGGADSSQSSVYERTLSGVAEAGRFIRQMLETKAKNARTGASNAQRKPTEIQLCVVGLGRTGSTSMYTALKQLGYTPLHDPERMSISDLSSALFAETIPVDEFANEIGNRGFDAFLYYGYDFVDWCVREKRRVVLTLRDDAKGWAESWRRAVPILDYLEGRPFVWARPVQEILPVMRYVCKDIPTAGRPERYKDLDALMEGYDIHNDKIRSMVPSELLLEFNVKEGWEPLCHFLGRDIPRTEFPHVNDKVVMKAILATFCIISWIWPLIPMGMLLIVLRMMKGFIVYIRRCDRNNKTRHERGKIKRKKAA